MSRRLSCAFFGATVAFPITLLAGCANSGTPMPTSSQTAGDVRERLAGHYVLDQYKGEPRYVDIRADGTLTETWPFGQLNAAWEPAEGDRIIAQGVGYAWKRHYQLSLTKLTYKGDRTYTRLGDEWDE